MGQGGGFRPQPGGGGGALAFTQRQAVFQSDVGAGQLFDDAGEDVIWKNVLHDTGDVLQPYDIGLQPTSFDIIAEGLYSAMLVLQTNPNNDPGAEAEIMLRVPTQIRSAGGKNPSETFTLAQQPFHLGYGRKVVSCPLSWWGRDLGAGPVTDVSAFAICQGGSSFLGILYLVITRLA